MFLTNPITTFLDNSPIFGDPIKIERTFIGWILNWVRVLGTALSLIVLTYMALRYILADADGGPHGKAELKKQFVNYTIGVVVFIAAANLIYYAEQIIEAMFLGI